MRLHPGSEPVFPGDGFIPPPPTPAVLAEQPARPRALTRWAGAFLQLAHGRPGELQRAAAGRLQRAHVGVGVPVGAAHGVRPATPTHAAHTLQALPARRVYGAAARLALDGGAHQAAVAEVGHVAAGTAGTRAPRHVAARGARRGQGLPGQRQRDQGGQDQRPRLHGGRARSGRQRGGPARGTPRPLLRAPTEGTRAGARPHAPAAQAGGRRDRRDMPGARRTRGTGEAPAPSGQTVAGSRPRRV